MTAPIPAGRGRWRLTLHNRAFAPQLSPLADLPVAELVNARSVSLDQTLNDSATLNFSLTGTDQVAALVRELQTDVMAWRWDETAGKDICMFRGVVAQSQDTISEQANTVQFTCHDYLDMLARRLLTAPTTFTNLDQDSIVNGLITAAKNVTTSGGTDLSPGSYLPLTVLPVDPSGAQRTPSAVLRDRQYPAQQPVGEAIFNLAAVVNGFDFDLVPGLQISAIWYDDPFRVFYPYQGVDRPDIVLEYGSSIRGLSRSVNSADYANYVRDVGNSQTADANAPQLYAEAVDASANDTTTYPQGLWMLGVNDSDVSVQSTLQQHAAGALKTASMLLPAYTLVLRPGFYSWGNPNMGDVVRLVVDTGRLNVDTSTRIVAIGFDVGDDGDELVTLGVGRADVTFATLFKRRDRDLNALARR